MRFCDCIVVLSVLPHERYSNHINSVVRIRLVREESLTLECGVVIVIAPESLQPRLDGRRQSKASAAMLKPRPAGGEHHLGSIVQAGVISYCMLRLLTAPSTLFTNQPTVSACSKIHLVDQR